MSSSTSATADLRRRPPPPPPHHRHVTKTHLLATIFPLSILILFITTTTTLKSDVSINQIHESRLQTLHLLKQQQLGLLELYSNKFESKINFTTILIEQISLNKRVQELLRKELGIGLELCRKVDEGLLERRTIEWRPRKGKYLFAVCTFGKMSNHLVCLQKHMFFAAVLDRVLVIPSSKLGYEYHRVLDIEGVNRCVGREVVVTFEEFARKGVKKRGLRIDRFVCYFSLPRKCFVVDEGDEKVDHVDYVKKLRALGVGIGRIEEAWVEDVRSPKGRSMEDVVAKFGCDEDVIAIGDVFFSEVEKEWVMQPGGPIAHKCKTLIEPGKLILVTAQRFIQTFLGENYIALHFRRNGFLKLCNDKKPSCFYPVPQAAECINRVVERTNAPVIYLSTDAAESETGLLQSLVYYGGKAVRLIKRPARNSAEKWDALLYRHKIEGDPQVEAMLDKTICALSSVFIGSSGSTFTEDILRLRNDWGSASVCDEYLCQGELPNFIAEDESN